MTSSDENPKVKLAGQEYSVPAVTFRDASKILPLVSTVFLGNQVTEDSLEGLATIVFHGIKRQSPDLTLDALMDMPITVEEMTAAAMVVCKQAGLKPKEPAKGEAKGTKVP